MENRKRRTSILKKRQIVETGESSGRRVSFHNVKHVKQYDRDTSEAMDISADQIPMNSSMNMSKVAIGNETMTIFQSPKKPEEKQEESFMDITQTPETLENMEKESEVKSNDSMDISIVPPVTGANDTMAIFQSPARKNLQKMTAAPSASLQKKQQLLEESMDIEDEETLLAPAASEAPEDVTQESMMITETSVFEEEAVLQTSMMELTPSEEDPGALLTSACRQIQKASSSSLMEALTSSSPGFDMPNVIYLTPEDVTKEPLPEAVEFSSLVAEEIQKSIETSKNSEVSMEKIDEAEFRFLELRLKFATEQRLKNEQQIKEIQSENAKIAEQLALKKELEMLKSRPPPTREECRVILKEWREMKQWAFDIQMKALSDIHETIMKIREQKTNLLMEIEEREEKLAQLEDWEKKKKATILEAVMDLMQ